MESIAQYWPVAVGIGIIVLLKAMGWTPPRTGRDGGAGLWRDCDGDGNGGGDGGGGD